jgi:hypothetical protein
MQLILFWLIFVISFFSLSSKDSVKWSPYQGKKTYQEAKDHCQNKGMRLPTMDELLQAEREGTTKNWSRNGSRYWAVNKLGEKSRYAIYLLGSEENTKKESHLLDSELGVFCANVTEESVVLDKIRELEENNGPSSEIQELKIQFYSTKFSEYQGSMDWNSANKKCKSIKMRLPTIEELKEAYKSGITKLWEKDGDEYWSSTPYDAESYYGLRVDDGSTYLYYRNSSYYVRCRR